eukprot:7730322-Karenia_brevis.AAC.1
MQMLCDHATAQWPLNGTSASSWSPQNYSPAGQSHPNSSCISNMRCRSNISTSSRKTSLPQNKTKNAKMLTI